MKPAKGGAASVGEPVRKTKNIGWASLQPIRAKTGVPMTLGSKILSGAANILLVFDAGIGFVKEGQEILNCQAGN